MTGSSDSVARSALTGREREIAEACSRGLRNKEIAAQLNVSTKTVKGHLNNIFRKLQVTNRLALALHMIERTVKLAGPLCLLLQLYEVLAPLSFLAGVEAIDL